MSSSVETLARFPPKLAFLFKPSRYKVAYGGRGGAKSWGFARALLIQASERKLRILCAREIQKSIKDSVHQVLSDQIEVLGLGWAYQILETEIRCTATGSNFIFSGLADKTTESIKSFEGIDIVWVEEARAVTKRSWSILIPTIRRDNSEIWVSFNPELDTDETYKRFVLNPPPDAVVVKISYHDNEWFPETLERARQHSLLTEPEDYDNIWEGVPRAAVAGAIYAKEITAAQEQGRICNVPYEPLMKVHVVCDLGFNDQMSIILVQRNLSELRIIDYIEDTHRTLDSYSSQVRDKHMNWGKWWLPHDAKHKTLAADGVSVQDTMKKLQWATEIVQDVGIEGGIKQARMAMPKTYFDKTKAERLIECLKRYRRAIPASTNEPGAPMHDEYSHGADAYRYLSVIADKLTNETWKPLKIDTRGVV